MKRFTVMINSNIYLNADKLRSILALKPGRFSPVQKEYR